ncbi:MAG: DMT family transporter [Lachnospiraceae bacterium]|nr:DMT family transporter [Lachnospiraceae bacterium]
MNRFVLRQSLLLLTAALIWGTAFVAQSIGVDYVQPFTFTTVRNVIGTLVLLPFIAVRKSQDGGMASRKSQDDGTAPRKSQDDGTAPRKSHQSNVVLGGMICGAALAVASNLQQAGIQYTTAGKAGFLTAMYIILVPIMSIFLKKRPGVKLWVGVFMAVIGMYFLCMTEGFVLSRGDFLVFLSAFAYATQILTIDYFGKACDGVKLACIQFIFCALFSAIGMVLHGERVTMEMLYLAAGPLLYTGVLSSGVAYTLQIIGQRGMNPTVASLIMSLESVISAIAGVIVLKEMMSSREIFGCVLMFASIVLVQLPKKEKKANGTGPGKTEYYTEVRS